MYKKNLMDISQADFEADFSQLNHEWNSIAVLKRFEVSSLPSLEWCLQCTPRASLLPLWIIFLPGSFIQGERRADPLPFCPPPPSEFPALTLTSSSYMGTTRQAVGERAANLCFVTTRVVEVQKYSTQSVDKTKLSFTPWLHEIAIPEMWYTPNMRHYYSAKCLLYSWYNRSLHLIKEDRGSSILL